MSSPRVSGSHSRLRQRLIDLIAVEGPLSVAQYMTLCLHDPADGYYAAHPALGASGDFITAPEVSQMFGEMIGLWAVIMWDQMGRPDPVRLVELGPGTGALMSDLLRAGRAVPGFLDAVDLWLVEPSRPLRQLQTERLANAAPHFVDRLEDVADGAPMILVANEVLDCLPARQFVHQGGVWFEQRIGLGAEGDLVFGLAPAPNGFAGPDGAPEGAVLEVSSAQQALSEAIGARIAEAGGAALLIDYGRDAPGYGDTFQAVSGHQKTDPLAAPGLADLTVHADFPSVAAAALVTGAETTAIVSQRRFLLALGLAERAQALQGVRPDAAPVIARQMARLVDEDQMGRLFKVLCIHSPGLSPPGFAPVMGDRL